MLCNLLLLSLLAPTYLPPAAAQAAPETRPDGTRDQRLEKLVEHLERARVSMHVPGMALAVVMDDEVVLTHGFGEADLETERAVTADTLFGIGSTTKAFTATLLGMLADEGALTWDDPVVEHLPYFQLNTGDSGEQATLRDLLCHRSGFTRMTLLSAARGVPRETILRTAAQAEPWAPFRKEFHYSNIMFLAAGVAAGETLDSTWEELITARILEPLGMSSTVTTYAAASEAPDLASGYLWDEDRAEFEAKPMVDIDSIGPAGSIVSNATDMAQWVRFQLAHGELDGERLISEESLDATRTGQIRLGPGMSYGLGWFVRDWNGQPMIEHGGNTEGFAAQVAFLPESGVGYALLTNTSITPLQGASMPMIFDTLLGELQAEGEDASEGPGYGEYVGDYIANFATFKDATFAVQVSDGKLAVDVPGQMLYALKDPDADGKWFFELTDTIAVSFERDDTDRIVGMTMYQGGFTFEIPREGVEITPDIPLEELQRFLGEYASDDGEAKGKVILQNNRLAIDVPGEMVFELHAPDEEQRWTFRVRSDLAVSFDESEDGRVEGLTLHRPGNESSLTRVSEDDAAEPLPSVDEIMQLRKSTERLAALDEARTRRYSGTARFVNSGLEGTYELLVDGRERYREKLDFGVFGITSNTVLGQSGFTVDPLRGVTPLDGKELGMALLAHPAAQAGDWRETYDKVRVMGVEEEDGRRLVSLRLTKGDLPASTVYVDLETGDTVRTEGIAPSDLIDIPVTTTLGDFREVDGVRVPHRVVIENDWNGRLVIQVDEISTGVDIDPASFELPAETKE